jgi:hypothetical protein
MVGGQAEYQAPVDAREIVAAVNGPDERPEVVQLLANIHRDQERLDRLARLTGEEAIYRYYHQSFKVYTLQDTTELLLTALKELNPRDPPAFHPGFVELMDAGRGREFQMADNDHWHAATGPVVEAFFHARYFVQQASKYGHELTVPPSVLPYGWAALLELYGYR